jgi:O-antigen/teichoic acid export membrane protein
VAGVLISGSKLVVLVTLPISLTLAILGERFIGLWMGQQFAHQAGQVLTVLALLQIVSAPHYVIASVLYGISKHRAMALVRAIEAAVSVSLSIFLAGRMGIVGVALALATAHGTSSLLVIPALARRFVGLPLMGYFAGVFRGPLLAALPFALAAFAIRERWPAASLLEFFLQVVLLVLLYVPCAFFFALTRKEQAMLTDQLRRRVRVPG